MGTVAQGAEAHAVAALRFGEGIPAPVAQAVAVLIGACCRLQILAAQGAERHVGAVAQGLVAPAVGADFLRNLRLFGDFRDCGSGNGGAVNAAAEGGDIEGVAVGGEADILQLVEQVIGKEGQLPIGACVDPAVGLHRVHGSIGSEAAVVDAVVAFEHAGHGISVIVVDAAVLVHPEAVVQLHEPAIFIAGNDIQIQSLGFVVGEAAHQHQLAQVDLPDSAGAPVDVIEHRRLPVAADTVVGGNQAVDPILGQDDVLAPDQALHILHSLVQGNKGSAAVIADVEAPVEGGHGDGQLGAVVQNTHFHGDAVGGQAGAVREVPGVAAVSGHAEFALGPVGVIGGGGIGRIVPVAPQAVDQPLGSGIKAQVIAGVEDVPVAAGDLHPLEALTVVIAVLQAQIRGADDDVVGIEGILPDGIGGLDIQAGGGIGTAFVHGAVGGIDLTILRVGVMDGVQGLRGNHAEIVVIGIRTDAVEGAVAAVTPAIVHNGVAGLVHGVKDPLEGGAIELHDTVGDITGEGQEDVVEIVADDLLEMPCEGLGLAPLDKGGGQIIQLHQVGPVLKIAGIEDPGGIGGIIEQEELIADPFHILQGALTHIQLGDGVRGHIVLPEDILVGVVHIVAPDIHHDLDRIVGNALQRFGIEDLQVAAVMIRIHQPEAAGPAGGGEEHLVIGGRHAGQVAVVEVVRQHQVFVPAAAADNIIGILGIDHLQGLAVVLAHIQAVAAGEDGTVLSDAGSAEPALGFRPEPGLTSVIGAVQAAHVAGDIEPVGIGGVDQRRTQGAAAANADALHGLPLHRNRRRSGARKDGQEHGKDQQKRNCLFHKHASFLFGCNSIIGGKRSFCQYIRLFLFLICALYPQPSGLLCGHRPSVPQAGSHQQRAAASLRPLCICCGDRNPPVWGITGSYC